MRRTIAPGTMLDMCNCYSHTKGQQVVIAFIRAIVDRTGNLPS